MYFEITNSPISVLPNSTQITNNIWLHRQHTESMQGYRLGEYGGNFVYFDLLKLELSVDFSFYKDFVLVQNPSQGILLTNINHIGPTVSQTVVNARITSNGIVFNHYDMGYCLQNNKQSSKFMVMSNVKNLLIENIQEIKKYVDHLSIAYSGGLDSSTLAWVAYEQKIKFTVVVTKDFEHIWSNLPFDCKYCDLTLPANPPKFAWASKTVEHFYQIDSCVGGFYGDVAVLHHNDLYHQSKNLIHHNSSNNYHFNTNSTLPKFSNSTQLKGSIAKIQLIPQFRHWFDHYVIYDAYRDPRIVKTVLQLSLFDLIDQFGSAYIQKYILTGIDARCIDFVCDYKNDYSKFDHC